LVEGNSIRSTERMTDTHRDTIMRLMVEVGTGCAALANKQMRHLVCRRIQCDEIWTFCRMKQARIPRFIDRTKIGDQCTLVAIDPDTKLIPAYRVGKRTRETAVAVMTDLSERLSNRVRAGVPVTRRGKRRRGWRGRVVSVVVKLWRLRRAGDRRALGPLRPAECRGYPLLARSPWVLGCRAFLGRYIHLITTSLAAPDRPFSTH
jgi:hypothetical protein